MAMRQALERFPDLTIEGFVYRNNNSGDLRPHLIETMRLAGFPSCAKSPADLSDASRDACLSAWLIVRSKIDRRLSAWLLREFS